MNKTEQLYEGKAKKVYANEDPNVVIVSYKDDATAFNGLKKGTIAGKGAINNRMTNNLMRRLEEAGIPTHYVQELNDRETAVKKVSIVPLEVIIRNISAGSFAKRYGVRRASCSTSPPSNSPTRTTIWGPPAQQLPRPGPEAGHRRGDRDHQALRLRRQRPPEGLHEGHRHRPGGLQAGVRPPAGRDHRPGGRDQPRHLPALGRKDPREAGQGPVRRDLGGAEEAYEEVMRRLMGDK